MTGVSGVHTWTALGNVSPFVFPIGVAPGQFASLTSEIIARGVEVRSLMGGAMHRHPAYQHLAHDGLKQCEALGGRSFFVGMHQSLEKENIERATAIVRTVLETE